MKKYLVSHEATVGRAVEGVMKPIKLLFYTMLEAESEDAVQDKLVQYKDPGFVSKVLLTAEVGEGLTAEELFQLLDQRKVLVEQAS